jgi:hypothetical protein
MEQNPLRDIDLDFTKPFDKISDLKEKIAAAQRGMVYAMSLNDIARHDELALKLTGFEDTLKLLQKAENQGPQREEEDAFSAAVGQEFGGALNKMDSRANRRSEI